MRDWSGSRRRTLSSSALPSWVIAVVFPVPPPPVMMRPRRAISPLVEDQQSPGVVDQCLDGGRSTTMGSPGRAGGPGCSWPVRQRLRDQRVAPEARNDLPPDPPILLWWSRGSHRLWRQGWRSCLPLLSFGPGVEDPERDDRGNVVLTAVILFARPGILGPGWPVGGDRGPGACSDPLAGRVRRARAIARPVEQIL